MSNLLGVVGAILFLGCTCGAAVELVGAPLGLYLTGILAAAGLLWLAWVAHTHEAG